MDIKLIKAIKHTRATMGFEGLETDKDAENLFIAYKEGTLTYDEMMDEIKKLNQITKENSDGK